MANLHTIQEVLNDPNIKAMDVRLLSHDMAIKAVIHTLPSLISLDREASENKPTAHRLLKFMKGYHFVACAYLLSDVLPHLSHLFWIFQKHCRSLVLPCLKTAIDSIKQYETSEGLDQVLIADLKDFNITPTNAQKQEFK